VFKYQVLRPCLAGQRSPTFKVGCKGLHFIQADSLKFTPLEIATVCIIVTEQSSLTGFPLTKLSSLRFEKYFRKGVF